MRLLAVLAACQDGLERPGDVTYGDTGDIVPLDTNTGDEPYVSPGCPTEKGKVIRPDQLQVATRRHLRELSCGPKPVDINGDGGLDLMVHPNGPRTRPRVLLSPSLDEVYDIPCMHNPLQMDINGDGELETVDFELNHSVAVDKQLRPISLQLPPTSDRVILHPAPELDGDGQPDFYSCRGGLTVYGSTGFFRQFKTSGPSVCEVLGDLNGDGKPEFLIFDKSETPAVARVSDLDQGFFPPRQSIVLDDGLPVTGGVDPWHHRVHDYNADGVADIGFRRACKFRSETDYLIFLLGGEGTPPKRLRIRDASARVQNSCSVYYVDINGDNFLDIVNSIPFGYLVSAGPVCAGTVDADKGIPIPSETNAYEALIGDLDGDGATERFWREPNSDTGSHPVIGTTRE